MMYSLQSDRVTILMALLSYIYLYVRATFSSCRGILTSASWYGAFRIGVIWISYSSGALLDLLPAPLSYIYCC